MSVKILMLVDHPLRNDVRVEKEARTLLKEGYDVEVWAVSENGLPNEEFRDGYRILRVIDSIITRPLTRHYKKFEAAFLIELLKAQFDVLHCHDFRMIILGARLKQLRPSVKLVYDAHEYLAGWPFYRDTPRIHNKIKGYIVWKWLVKEERKAAVYADLIITVSESLSLELKDYFKAVQKPLTLRNLPHSFPLHTEKYFHDLFGIPFSDKVFVFSGGLRAGKPSYNWKSLMNIIKAIDSIDNCSIVFIGDSDRHPLLKEKIRLALLGKKVYFHKKVSPFEAGYLISSADVAIVNIWQPDWKSYLYSLSNRVLEFSMAGLPVLCCRLVEYVKLNENFNHMIFTDFEDLDKVKKGIRQIIQEHAELKKNALKIPKAISWETEAKNLVEAYIKLEPATGRHHNKN